jgi:hypothetical protein
LFKIGAIIMSLNITPILDQEHSTTADEAVFSVAQQQEKIALPVIAAWAISGLITLIVGEVYWFSLPEAKRHQLIKDVQNLMAQTGASLSAAVNKIGAILKAQAEAEGAETSEIGETAAREDGLTELPDGKLLNPETGKVYTPSGHEIGQLRGDGTIARADGSVVVRDGRVIKVGKVIGTLQPDGTVRTPTGAVIGGEPRVIQLPPGAPAGTEEGVGRPGFGGGYLR